MFTKAVSKVKLLYQGQPGSVSEATVNDDQPPLKKRKRQDETDEPSSFVQDRTIEQEKGSFFAWWNSSRFYQQKIEKLQKDNNQLLVKITALKKELETTRIVVADLSLDLDSISTELDKERAKNKKKPNEVSPSLTRSPPSSPTDAAARSDKKMASPRTKRAKTLPEPSI